MLGAEEVRAISERQVEREGSPEVDGLFTQTPEARRRHADDLDGNALDP